MLTFTCLTFLTLLLVSITLFSTIDHKRTYADDAKSDCIHECEIYPIRKLNCLTKTYSIFYKGSNLHLNLLMENTSIQPTETHLQPSNSMLPEHSNSDFKENVVNHAMPALTSRKEKKLNQIQI